MLITGMLQVNGIKHANSKGSLKTVWYIFSNANVCDIKNADSPYVCKIVHNKKNIAFCLEYDMN